MIEGKGRNGEKQNKQPFWWKRSQIENPPLLLSQFPTPRISDWMTLLA
jgi:hypothetical protein